MRVAGLLCLVAVLLTVVADDVAENLGTPIPPSSSAVNQLNATSFTSTSVLLQWTSTMLTDLYNVSYSRLTTNTGGGGDGRNTNNISTCEEARNELITTVDSVLLVSLTPNTSYCVTVCIIAENAEDHDDLSNLCGDGTFTTSPATAVTNQVEGVQAHVFYPLLNNISVISAQIFWTALSRPRFYDVRVRTADKDMKNITNQDLFELPPQNTFVNIVTRTALNEIEFPLIIDKIYYVQVRGRGDIGNFSWSEPVLIDTLNVKQEPQFLIRTMQQQQLYFIQTSPFKMTLLPIAGLAIAIDKIDRAFFYATANNIMRANIDTPNMPQVISEIPADGNLITAMTYDWISKRLYIAVREGAQAVIYYVVVDTGEMKQVEGFSTLIIRDMAINPFTGKLYFVHLIGQGNRLAALNVETMVGKDDVLKQVLSSPTLAKSVLNDCVYTVVEELTIKGHMQGSQLCEHYDAESANPLNIRLATDDRGIYYSDGSKIHFYEYLMGGKEPISTAVFESNTIGWFDVISPGSHPFPSQQSCLSPDISSTNVFINRTATSIVLQWNQPDTTMSTDCTEDIVSVPPILYIIDISDANNNSRQQFQTYQTSLTVTSLNMTDLDSSLGYGVRLRARTEFFIGQDTAIPILDIESIAPFTAETISTNMPSASTTTRQQSRVSSTILSTSIRTSYISTVSTVTATVPTQSPVSDNSTAIVAGVTVSVGFVIIVLVIVIIIVAVLMCTRSRKSYKMNSNSARYIRRESNDQPNNFPPTANSPVGANHLQNPTPYESPLTLSTKTLLTNSTEKSNGSVTDPYAIPADSIDQYRTSQLANSLGQEYEVPLPSRTNTLANNGEPPRPSNEPHPPVNVYSTLDDAAVEKQQFTQSDSVTIPNKYNSLYPPNMTLPHSYGHYEMDIEEAPELYSEPITSPRRTSKGSPPVGVVKGASKVGSVRGNGAECFDNPVYGFESTNHNGATVATDNHTYSSLDRSVGGVPDRSNSHSHSNPHSHTALGKTYSTLSDMRDDPSEPTYFKLENPQDLPRARSKSHNPNKPDPTYFELEKSAITRSSSNTHNRSVSPGEPTYFQLEKPSNDPHFSPTEPTYFELEKPRNSISNPSNGIKDGTVAQEPTYFEVRPRKSSQDSLKQLAVDNHHYETSHQYSELNKI